MKRVIKLLLVLILAIACVVLYKTFVFKPKVYASAEKFDELGADPNILAKAIQFETISHKAGMIDDSAFVGYHNFLDATFPLIDSLLKKEIFNEYTLLYTWKGSNPDLKPVIIMAHQDVVPAEYSTLDEWHFPPFSGEITDEFIYGRGALDDKGSMISIMIALEGMLKRKIEPERTLMFCFGHDEEIGGEDGAKQVSEALEKRGIEAHAVVDEGGNMVLGIVPGIDAPVALVGTSEKGYMSLELSADIAGGHSSMPERNTAIGVLSRALCKLENNPMPNVISPSLEGFIDHIGPNLPFVQKMAFANRWLFEPLIFNVYEQSASGSALIHTTQAFTIFQAGIKDNVIPNRAKATVNFRLLPGDEPKEILQRTIDVINDTLVKVRVFENTSVAASPSSNIESDAFKTVCSSIKANFPDAVISPYLVIAATDSRYFYKICDNVFRFAPISLEREDLSRLHGINERVSIDDFRKSVTFYATLISEFSH